VVAFGLTVVGSGGCGGPNTELLSAPVYWKYNEIQFIHSISVNNWSIFLHLCIKDIIKTRSSGKN
jgi:hypothetical protein